MISNIDWEVLVKKALGTIRLSLSSPVAFNIFEEKNIEDLMTVLKKPSTSNIVFLMKMFHMKMIKGRAITKHLNELNTVTSGPQ